MGALNAGALGLSSSRARDEPELFELPRPFALAVSEPEAT